MATLSFRPRPGACAGDEQHAVIPGEVRCELEGLDQEIHPWKLVIGDVGAQARWRFEDGSLPDAPTRPCYPDPTTAGNGITDSWHNVSRRLRPRHSALQR